jgi:hypothetical protein
MKHINNYSLFALLVSVSLAMPAWAQKDAKKNPARQVASEVENDGAGDSASDENDPPSMKVIKVRKNVATVVFSRKHGQLKVGQRGRLVEKIGPAGCSEDVVEGPSRDRFISFNASLSMLSTGDDKGGASSSNSVFDTNIVYGWNKERVEYGLLLGYRFTKQDPANDTRTIELGGRFDYNFVSNKVENDMVFGARIDAAIGQADSSGASKASNTMRVEPGIFVKWFGLSTNLAMTGVVGYRYSTISTDDAKTKTTGIVGSVGIETYF